VGSSRSFDRLTRTPDNKAMHWPLLAESGRSADTVTNGWC